MSNPYGQISSLQQMLMNQSDPYEREYQNAMRLREEFLRRNLMQQQIPVNPAPAKQKLNPLLLLEDL